MLSDREIELPTIQKVSQCARPENSTIRVGRELGEDANQRVEGEAGDLQEVRLADHQYVFLAPFKTAYIWRTDEVKQRAELSFGHQSSLQGCNDGFIGETSQGGARSIKFALPR